MTYSERRLLARLTELEDAIRSAETLEELTRLVGPTKEENAEAVKRSKRLDVLSRKIYLDQNASPFEVEEFARLNKLQTDFERRYA